MSIFEILVCNLLIISGICKSISEAMTYPHRERAEKVIKSFLHSFARDLNLLGGKGKPDLWMGVNNLPIDKQYSLRVFCRDVEPYHIIRAIHHLCEEQRLNFDETTSEDVICFHKVIRPMLLLLNKDFSEEELLRELEKQQQ